MKNLKYFLIFLLFAPLLFKAQFVDNFVTRSIGERFVGASQVLANDATIFLILVLLVYCSFLKRTPFIASVLLRIISTAIYLVVLLDYYVITNFSTRLFLGDIVKYASYAPKYMQQIFSGTSILLFSTTLATLFFIYLYLSNKQKIKSRKIHATFILTFIFLTMGFFIPKNNQYIHSWMYKNVIDYNISMLSESKAYSKEFIANLSYIESRQCTDKIPSKPNVIILMVESLSSYQSQYFSGINNWTPNLDRIAKKNISFINFYANGFTTEDGEISLLTGQFPIYAPASFTGGGYRSFDGFFNYSESLPYIFNLQDYQTEFLTTADLAFGNTRNWAESIGFKYIEGHEHSEYDNWERFHFKAAPDEALYKRIQARIQENGTIPYFIFVKTVTTHHPFIDPESGEKSAEKTFRYADAQLGKLYQQLEDQSFFDNGLLIIVGDHHAMIPLRKEEIDQFGGNRASARVPMVLATNIFEANSKPAIIDKPHQQVDVYNSVKHLTEKQICTSQWMGDIFSEGKTYPKFIVHRRGDNRNQISIFTEESDYMIQLDGDKTSLMEKVDGLIDANDKKTILDKINKIRITRSSN